MSRPPPARLGDARADGGVARGGLGAEHAPALDDVAQLADVAGKIVAPEHADGLIAERRVGGATGRDQAAVELALDVIDQHRDVVDAGVQGGDPHDHHREAEVEVLAELAGFGLGDEVAVGGGDDAHVHRLGVVAAH